MYKYIYIYIYVYTHTYIYIPEIPEQWKTITARTPRKLTLHQWKTITARTPQAHTTCKNLDSQLCWLPRFNSPLPPSPKKFWKCWNLGVPSFGPSFGTTPPIWTLKSGGGAKRLPHKIERYLSTVIDTPKTIGQCLLKPKSESEIRNPAQCYLSFFRKCWNLDILNVLTCPTCKTTHDLLSGVVPPRKHIYPWCLQVTFGACKALAPPPFFWSKIKGVSRISPVLE